MLLSQAADEDGERGLGLQAVQARAGELRMFPYLIIHSVMLRDA